MESSDKVKDRKIQTWKNDDILTCWNNNTQKYTCWNRQSNINFLRMLRAKHTNLNYDVTAYLMQQLYSARYSK